MLVRTCETFWNTVEYCHIFKLNAFRCDYWYLVLNEKARASDGLLLCEVVHNQGRVGFESRRQAKLFLRSGQKRGEVDYQSVETGDKSLKAVYDMNPYTLD